MIGWRVYSVHSVGPAGREHAGGECAKRRDVVQGDSPHLAHGITIVRNDTAGVFELPALAAGAIIPPKTAAGAAAGALRAAPRLAHAERATVDHGAVDAGEGFTGGPIAFHLHEGKPFALAGSTVDDAGHFAYLTVRGEQP